MKLSQLWNIMSSNNKLKIHITHPEVPSKALDIFKQEYDLVISQGIPFPTRNQILNDIKGASGVLWAVGEKFDQEMVDAAGLTLKVVATKTAGYENIDVGLLKSRYIQFSNTPEVVSNPTAEVAMGLLLSTAHRLNEGYQSILRGKWETGRIQWMLGQSLEKSTVGIVGLGGIGCSVAKKLKAFDVSRILYTGHTEKQEGKTLGCEFVTLDHLLQESDFIIISCILTEETRHMFNQETFKKMKPTSILVNVSRGGNIVLLLDSGSGFVNARNHSLLNKYIDKKGLVRHTTKGVIDQEALVEALKNKTIWGAGLDVMTPEPLPSDHPLTKLSNCVLSPHLGTATIQAEEAMSCLAAQNIYNALNDLPLLTPVL